MKQQTILVVRYRNRITSGSSDSINLDSDSIKASFAILSRKKIILVSDRQSSYEDAAARTSFPEFSYKRRAQPNFITAAKAM